MLNQFLHDTFISQLRDTVGSTRFSKGAVSGFCVVSRDQYSDGDGNTFVRLTFVTAAKYGLNQGDIVSIDGFGRFKLGQSDASDLISYQCMLDPA